MDRAYAGKVIARGTSDANMAKLGMERTVQRLAVDHDAATDAGANGQIDMDRASDRRAPPAFGQGRACDIGIEPHRHVEPARDAREQVRTGPPRLGRVDDGAIIRS